MDLNSAGLFVSVVDLGSFRKAALHLGVPVSTLSERITGLERALGVALLIRTTRRLTVTDAGRDLYDGCAAAVAALREAEERVSGLVTTPAGTLRITAPAEFAEVQLADAIREHRLAAARMVREALRAGRLVRVLPRWATAPIPVHIVVPQLRVPSTKTKDMVALLHARLQPLLAKEF